MNISRAAGALVFLLAGLFATGCSRAAMDAHPFRDQDTGQADAQAESENRIMERVQQTRERAAAGRINIWPFLYRDREDLSVLWPIFAASEQGHATLPFYEWQRAGRALRILTLHHWVPSFAVFERGGEYWRVFNTVRRGGEQGGFHVFPFILYNQYDAEKNSRHWHAGPLLFHHSSTPEWEFTSLLGPLYFRYRNQERESGYDWLPVPLVHRTWDQNKRAYAAIPLGVYRREFEADGHHFYTLPLSIGSDNESHWGNLGLILAFWQGERKVQSRFHLLLGILYNQRIIAESAARSTLREEILEPGSKQPAETSTLLRRRESLFGLYRYREDLAGAEQTRAEVRRLDPEEMGTRRSADAWLFPLYYWARTEEERHFNLLWRLYIFRAEAIPEGGEYRRRQLLWRLYDREDVPGATAMDIFPFASYDRLEDFKRFRFLGGLYEFRRDGQDRRIRLLFIPIKL